MTEQNNAITTYKEKKIGNTIYRVTSIFTGEKDLGETLERLAIDRVICDIKKGAEAILKV